MRGVSIRAALNPASPCQADSWPVSGSKTIGAPPARSVNSTCVPSADSASVTPVLRKSPPGGRGAMASSPSGASIPQPGSAAA